MTKNALTPRSALITGGAQRIGLAMAMDLARHGWQVVIHHNTTPIGDTLEHLTKAGAPKVASLQADILDESQVDGLVAKAADLLGRPITLLINNASIFEMERLPDSTRRSWDRHIESNLRTPVYLTQQFAAQVPKTPVVPDIEPTATGCVINMLDQRVWKPTPYFMSYTIAKMGLWGFTQVAALELAPHIRVNAIGPGPTIASVRQSDAHFQQQRRSTVLQRGTNIEDICQAMQYLVNAPAVTGQMIAVDGAQHLDWRIASVVNAHE